MLFSDGLLLIVTVCKSLSKGFHKILVNNVISLLFKEMVYVKCNYIFIFKKYN